MRKEFVTTNFKQTRKLGEMLAREILDIQCPKPVIICLTGELGSGKTTFTQGMLKGLKVKGPYTSPTFTIMKEYKVLSRKYKAKKDKRMRHIYHIDAYRVTAKDILNLGWKEITADKNNIVIIEWADRIKKIIPKESLRISFKWIDNNTRKIILKTWTKPPKN